MFLEYMRSKIFKIFSYQFICLIPEIGSASSFPGYHTGADGITSASCIPRSWAPRITLCPGYPATPPW